MVIDQFIKCSLGSKQFALHIYWVTKCNPTCPHFISFMKLLFVATKDSFPLSLFFFLYHKKKEKKRKDKGKLSDSLTHECNIVIITFKKNFYSLISTRWQFGFLRKMILDFLEESNKAVYQSEEIERSALHLTTVSTFKTRMHTTNKRTIEAQQTK